VSKATKILLAAALALGGLIVSVAAEIPEDLWSTANTWAFLASMGQRCETRLEWQGYAGVNDEVCQDFQDQDTHVSTEFSAKKEAFEDAARAVDATRGTHKIRAETIANI
jgi:hypothetical protein